jgi:hypothetical protein
MLNPDVIAVTMLVWSMLGLHIERDPEAIPRAWIVRPELRAYVDAVLIRIGEAPILALR